MGNVNETQEKEYFPPNDDLSGSAPEFDDTESVSSSVLDRDALDSDLPIKLFFPSRSSSEFGADESVVESPTSFEDPEHIIQHIACTETVEPDEDLPKDDSFPLSESALPSSFDLLMEASPNPSDNSDIFHTPEISVDSTEENPVACIQSSPGVAMELFFPSTNDDDVGHVPEDIPVQPSPLEDAQWTPEESLTQCQQDSYDLQIQVSQALLANIKDMESDHDTETCEDLEDLQSECANSIEGEYQDFSSLLVLGQLSAMGAPDFKAMNEEEVDNPNDHAYEDLQSKSAPRLITNSPSLNSLFSRLVLDDFHNRGVANLNAEVDGNVVAPNAQACSDDKGSLRDMVRMTSTSVVGPNESQSSPPTRDVESMKELITLSEIGGFPIDEASDFSFSFSSASLDWAYPADGYTESLAPRPQSEIGQDPESDINSLFPLLNFCVPLPDPLESTLPLESSGSESQIPLLYSVTPSTTESSSLETKIDVLHSLETSETVSGNGHDEEQDQTDFKLSESPIMITDLLNISSESFIPNEPNSPSDSLVAPLPCDLAMTTTPENRTPSLPHPLLRGESDIVERHGAHSLSITQSLDHEGTIEATFLDTGNPATMEFDEAHIPLLKYEGALNIISADAENTETSSVVIPDEVHPLSIISHVEQKQMIDDNINPPNSSHEAQVKQSSACFTHPKHSTDRPNWALAPVDLPEPQTRLAKKTTKTENKRTLSRRGKQKADDLGPTGKTIQAQATNSSYQSAVKPTISVNSSYMLDSPSNKSLERLRFKSSVATSSIPPNKSQQAPANSNAALSAGDYFVVDPSIKLAASGKTHRQRAQADLNVSEMHAEKEQVLVKTIGSGHWARRGSVSFRQIQSSEKMSVLMKGNDLELLVIEQAATTVKAKETDRRPTPTLRDSSITLNICDNNTETVKNKIAAILSETRSRKSSGVQPSRNSVSKNDSKTGSTAMQINAAPPIRVGGPQQSRVSWPSDEQEFQATGRPPLPWRAGIGKVLSFHSPSTQDTQLRPSSATSVNHNRRKSHVEDAHSHHSTIHHEFSLHARERDEPVRVNLPSQFKPSKGPANLLPSDSDMANYSSSRPIFHSHIPVATRVLVNRSVGPESDTAVPAASMSFTNAEGWQSSTPFPQAHLAHHISAANPPRICHRYCTFPEPNPYLQDSMRASANGSSVPNLPAQMHHSGSRSSIPAGPGHQSQYPFSAMQRARSREFLNNVYLQAQHRERKHVESALPNHPGSTPFATNFYPAIGDALEWGNEQAARPSDAVFFEDRRHRLNDISGSPSTSHGFHVPQQEMDHRNFSNETE